VFQLIVEFMAAWNQIGFLIGGTLFAGIGLLLLGNRIYWRILARREAGTIIGVRELSPRSYYPVYRYTSNLGETVEATSNSGSNSTRGMETGRKVELLVLESDPHRAADAGTLLTEILGSIISAFGIGFFYIALTVLPVTRVTWIALAGSVGWAAFKLHSLWRKHPWSAALSANKMRKRQELKDTPIRPAEDIAPPTEVAGHQRINPALPAILVSVGMILLAMGFYEGHNVLHLTQAGQRATGTVVRMELGTGSGNESTYHAIVRFSLDEDTQIEFQDRVATNPPSLRPGDAVTVLYSPDSPQRSAMIDRRIWNWLPTAALLVFGTVLGAVGVHIRRIAQSRNSQLRHQAQT
jgi:Protein of unknown function (DUF3592)